MQTRAKFRVVALWCVLITFMPQLLLSAADTIAGSQRLSADTFVYLSVPNVEQLKGNFLKTNFAQLLKTPGMKSFLEQFQPTFEKFADKFSQEMGMKFKDLLELPEGEITFALALPELNSINFICVMDIGEKKHTLDKLITKAQAELAKKNVQKSREEIADTEIQVYTFPDTKSEDDDDLDEETQNPFGNKVCYMVKDNHFVISNTLKEMESVLVRWNGQNEKTLANDSIYKYVMQRVRGELGRPDMEVYVNIQRLMNFAIDAAKKDNPQAAMFEQFLPQLGLRKLNAFGFTAYQATDKFDGISRGMLYVEQPTNGLLNIFTFPTADLTPAKWVTADVDSFQSVNWDINKAYEAIATTFDNFNGQGRFDQIVDNLATNEAGPQIHIKKDFLDQLTGQINIVTDIDEKAMSEQADDIEELATSGLGSPGQRMLFAFKTKDSAKMQTVLSKLAAMPQAALMKEREFRGQTIYEFKTPLAPYAMGLGLAKNNLVFATDVRLLEEMLRSDPDKKSLVDSPLYKQLASHFPETVSALAYQRTDTQVESLYKMLRSGKLMELFADELPDDIEADFSKLPEFEQVRKYLPVSGSYMIPDRNGALFISINLKNNGTK